MTLIEQALEAVKQDLTTMVQEGDMYTATTESQMLLTDYLVEQNIMEQVERQIKTCETCGMPDFNAEPVYTGNV